MWTSGAPRSSTTERRRSDGQAKQGQETLSRILANYLANAVKTESRGQLDLLTLLLEFQARQQDQKSNIHLLQKLLLKYAATERMLAEINMQLKEKQRLLTEANLKLDLLAHLDGLTGIANRRHLDSFLVQEWRRAQRGHSPISVILIDIDFFKRFNDSYGHQMGDDCLRKVAASLQSVIKRPADLVARYGGEEFAVVMPDTPLEGAEKIAEDLRREVFSLGIPHAESSVASVVTISLGLASLVPISGRVPEDVWALADQALYRAKTAGRNRVEVAYASA